MGKKYPWESDSDDESGEEDSVSLGSSDDDDAFLKSLENDKHSGDEDDSGILRHNPNDDDSSSSSGDDAVEIASQSSSSSSEVRRPVKAASSSSSSSSSHHEQASASSSSSSDDDDDDQTPPRKNSAAGLAARQEDSSSSSSSESDSEDSKSSQSSSSSSSAAPPKKKSESSDDSDSASDSSSSDAEAKSTSSSSHHGTPPTSDRHEGSMRSQTLPVLQEVDEEETMHRSESSAEEEEIVFSSPSDYEDRRPEPAEQEPKKRGFFGRMFAAIFGPGKKNKEESIPPSGAEDSAPSASFARVSTLGSVPVQDRADVEDPMQPPPPPERRNTKMALADLDTISVPQGDREEDAYQRAPSRRKTAAGVVPLTQSQSSYQEDSMEYDSFRPQDAAATPQTVSMEEEMPMEGSGASKTRAADPEQAYNGKPDPPGSDKPKLSDEETARRRRCIIIALVCLLVGSAVGIVIGLYAVDRNKGSSDDGGSVGSRSVTSAPTAANAVPTTVQPTATPVAAPVESPILMPVQTTNAPIFIPPPPTDVPNQPSTDPPTFSVEDEVVVTVTSVSSVEELGDPLTPQARSLAWLLTNSRLATYDRAKIIRRWVLGVFYYATDGDNWTDNTNWMSDFDECTWLTRPLASTCNSERNFARLQLVDNNVQGNLPAELVLLADDLEVIRLDDNGLVGSIPTEYTRLSQLTVLSLADNSLSNGIPADLNQMSGLIELDLSNNSISGNFPLSIAALNSLQILNVAGNSMAGLLPAEIGGLASLESLDLSFNSFAGAIPNTFGNLGALQSFNGNDNDFIFLPDTIGSCSSLTSLMVARNNLQGPLEAGLVDLSLLEILDLSDNNLSQGIPTTFGNLNNLQVLDLRANSMTGNIPTQLANLSSIQSIYLERNSFVGRFPLGLCPLYDPNVSNFHSDCVTEVDCSCCNKCCQDGVEECVCPFQDTNPILCLP